MTTATTVDISSLRINGERLWASLMELAQIGATPKGGVKRLALTDLDKQGRDLVVSWGKEAGLSITVDKIGNVFMRREGTNPALPPIVSGSHIDTQPTGGKFDGNYGVLSALEVVRTLNDHGIRTEAPVEVAFWTNEEGSRFAPGMMGSEAFAGVRSLEAVRAVRDAKGVSVADALDALHAAFAELPRRTLGFPLKAYVEAHIEQGPVLEAQEHVIGVVTGIQGKKTFDIVIEGERGHAGTLAMVYRRDALEAFTRIAGALYAEIGGYDEAVKFTIGRLQVEPNAPSVVPERVTLRIDLRHPDNAVLAYLGE
eukprot:gene41743-55368_t